MFNARYLIPASAGVLLLGSLALADTGGPQATGSVAYRQHSMSAMAEHMAVNCFGAAMRVGEPFASGADEASGHLQARIIEWQRGTQGDMAVGSGNRA